MFPEIFNTGLNSKIWGNGAWVFLHSITLNYPNNPTENDKKTYKSFFETLGYLLPCNECSNHYNDYLQSNPINYDILENKESLTIWLYNLHNNVNHIIDNEKIDFKEFVDIYYNMYSNNNNSIDINQNDIIYYIIVLIIIIGIVGLVIYKNKC